MQFDTRKDQVEWVVGRLMNWISGFLGEEDRQLIGSVSTSLYGLIALEIVKNRHLSELPFWDAVERLKEIFAERSQTLEEAAQKMTGDDREKLLKYVRVLSELVGE